MVRRYLEEAYRCFVGEAYNGAVVMTWNAAAYYLRQVVDTVSVALFRYNYTVLHGQAPHAELWRVNDNLFIQTCERAGILCDVIPELDRLRDRRNDCAHPSGVFVSEDEVVELAESVRHVLSRHARDERLTNPASLREFVRVASYQDARVLADWVREDLCSQLAHDLLTIFKREDRDISGVIGLWRGLWNRVDDSTRQRLWDRIEGMVPAVLTGDENTPRTPEELVRMIVWPNPGDEHPARDRVGLLFVEWFEQLAQSGEFTAADMELAKTLRQHLPVPLYERLQAALQEMTRRYTE